MRVRHLLPLVVGCILALAGCGDENGPTAPVTEEGISLKKHLPSHENLRAQLRAVLEEQNGGLGFEMWATILDRDGRVVDVVFSGEFRGDQWPGSRVISAQKANTANAFSLAGLALSTANLFAAVQPGGSLYGLQESNPVNPDVAYKGPASAFGTRHDPMIGERIGGVNVFGGGLALYSSDGRLLGGLGISGDTSCTDHIVAWKLRHALNLDNVPGGVGAGNTDNIIYTEPGGTIDGFEHPTCINVDGQGDATEIGNNLPTTQPVGPGE
ncbi:MAG TPA: heme-binding protein [Gemmatimonadales bacterium]|nr:heme-binding protein [Gemmatimonadales bacterium]